MRRDKSVYEYMPRQVLNRHWVWVFLWMVVGVVLSRTVGAYALWLAVPACIAGLAALFVPVTLPRRSHIGLALLLLALGCFLYAARKSDASNDTLHQYALTYPTQRAYFEGVVSDADIYFAAKGYLSFVLCVKSAVVGEETKPLQGSAVVRWTRANAPIYPAPR